MLRTKYFYCFFALFIGFLLLENLGCTTKTQPKRDYSDLVSLFNEFREFMKPRVIDGVPDYSKEAMKRQYQKLKEYQKRLDAFDISQWPVSQQVDYHIVRAEMNGLEFNHRVLCPWFRDPGFYCIIPRFEETMVGTVSIPRQLLLPKDRIENFRSRLRALPKILEQAKSNLTEVARDLATLAIKMKQREHDMWTTFAERLEAHHPDLIPDVKKVIEAIDDFKNWMEENKSRWTAPAGVGKENYNWLLKNVYLFPYTWEECMAVVQRELERSQAYLKMEEHRNRNLPELVPVTTREDFEKLHLSAQEYLINFLKQEEIFTVPNSMTTKSPPRYERPGGFRNFFEECLDRDPLPLIVHDIVGHTPDAERQRHDERPIRGKNRPYHIAGIRAEALATGMEELLTHAGLLDERRRSRELMYVLVGFRAARAAADLKMHANELTFEEALEYTAKMTPRGYAKADSFLLWDDLELYLRQPGYGMGYLMGKVQLDKLLVDRSRQLGNEFSLKQFFDEFFAAGMIPISLIRWEMTGLEDEINKLW